MADLKAGDAVPELKVTPDKYLTNRYAGASGDFNPIHIDPEFAKAVGLPGTILPRHSRRGPAVPATAAVAGGDPRALKRLSVQFRGHGGETHVALLINNLISPHGDTVVVDTVAA